MATMTNANISELPRMILSPQGFVDQGFLRERDFERIKPSSYLFGLASPPFPPPSSFGPGPGAVRLSFRHCSYAWDRCATNLDGRFYAGLFQVACKFANRARANRELFRHFIRAFLAAPRASGAVKEPARVFIELTKEKAILNLGEKIDQAYAPYGLFLLRLAIGIDWLAHAFLKTSRGMYTHEALLAKNGITPLLAWPTFTLEVIGGIAIILGWYSRQWAAFLLFFLATVVWIKWPVGWTYSNTGGGWEYPLFWLFAQAALVLCGEGAFALRRSAFPKPA